MRKVWLVMKREYLTRVRTKSFLFSTILIPVLLVGYFIFIVVISSRESGGTTSLAIADETGQLGPAVAGELKDKLPNGKPSFEAVETLGRLDDAARADLRKRILTGQLGACLIIPSDVLEGKDVEYYTRNPGDLTRIGSIRRAVNNVLVSRRLTNLGIHVDDIAKLTHGVDIKLVKVTPQGESEESGQTLLAGFVVAMLLYMTLIIYGVSTMRSVLEEKTSRVVEVLVSSLRPVQLLGGKILGVAAVGLTQYLVWTISGGLVATYGAAMAAAVRPGTPPFQIHLPAGLLVYTAVFFLGGYFLYAALYAAVGSMVSTEQDAQQMQIPVILPLVLSLLLLNIIIRDSNSTASVVLSLIPFFSPILMIFRITLQTPPFWQIALSLALLLATTLGAVWFSARIYRVGILMYGKRPSVVEVFKWLRYS